LTAQPAISLTIGNNITLIGRTNGEHGANSDNNAGVVFVRNGASFVMLDGSKITGNTNNVPGVAGNAGAALTVNTGASFNMQGGTITGNAAVNATADHVGGVVVRGVNSSFTMSGGAITGNTVGGRQGTPRDVLIHNDNGVTFTQTGGTIRVLDNRLP
ncbi:MAG: hypothetical protein FWC64_07515, partial [Treponema sp.]|nr:hypothetical protein [Treponema sp.]